MPGFDKTGPAGQGPMTGGGRGLCNPQNRATGYGPNGEPYPAAAPPAYGTGRPRWGLRGFFGRGFRGGRGGRGGRGRGRW